MINIRSNYMMSELANMGFMVLATGLAIYTGYFLLASIFGAKVVLSLYLMTTQYHRNRRMRFQLVEHLYRADVNTKTKR